LRHCRHDFFSGFNLSQTGALDAVANVSNNDASTGAVVATGFMPRLEASGGGTNGSATNIPVFQVQRIDNEQMRFIPSDGTIEFSDTQFAGKPGALGGFPVGPLMIRVWVNGVPSWARYARLTAPCAIADTIFCGGFER
jgi:hypothetical protein